MPLSLTLYRLGVALLEPFTPAILRGRARRLKEDPARLGERLGHASVARPDASLVWVHAVSVGESLSALPLIQRLRERAPGTTVLVTSGTLTSANLLARRLPDGVIHQYAPLDTPGASRRFLDHWRPDVAIFIESEFWPNLILGADRRGAKLVLMSARVTERTAKGWARAPGLAKTVLKAFDLVLPQDRATAQRLARYGVGGPLVNLKFVAEPLPVDLDAVIALQDQIGGRPAAVAASTHPGEEAIVARLLQIPNLLLIIAPRHPNRGDAVVREMRALGFETAQRTRDEPIRKTTRVYVADTLGELGLLFGAADVVVMGGGFLPDIGGHNPLEPARIGAAPVLSGPHVFNFADIYEEMAALGFARIVPSAEALVPMAAEILGAKAGAGEEGARAAAYAASRMGALDDAWAQLEAFLP